MNYRLHLTGINIPRAILCEVVKESRLLYVQIYTYCAYFYALSYRIWLTFKQIYLTHRWDPILN